MRLIDADRLYNTIIDEIDPISISMDGGEMRGMMRTIIAAEPTVDAVPVVHGRWEPDKFVDGCFLCSVCHDCWGAAAKMTPMKYCPTCGALMDGKKDEQDADGA